MAFYERPGGNISDGERKLPQDVAYDFRTMKVGRVVCILTDKGMHELKKVTTELIGTDNGEPVMYTEKPLAGWEYAGEPVELTVLEPNEKGTSFLTWRSVLRAEEELGINFIERDLPDAAIMHNLGRVAGFAEMLETEYEEFIDA